MKLSRYAALTALGLGMGLLAVAERPALAKAPPAAGGAGVIEKSMQISPKGLRWGLSLEAVSKLYDGVIEQEMLPLFRKAQPGLELDALNEEQKNRKGALRRSRIDFGATPTGVDQSALKGEYSYNNGESLAMVTLPTRRSGRIPTRSSARSIAAKRWRSCTRTARFKKICPATAKPKPRPARSRSTRTWRW
jgi:hypothetical protein